MSLLLKCLLAVNNNHLNRYKKLLTGLVLLLCYLNFGIQSARAEGSRTLYPSNAPAGSSRANLEWRTDTYGGLVLRRTLLKVYANKDEYILLGSSAVGVGSGNIRVYNPNSVSGSVGSEIIPTTPDFQCSSQPGRGVISSRQQELSGPRAISGTGNPNGYIPCFYQAPSTGVYDIVFYGSDGGNSSTNGTPTGQINLSSGNNFNTSQGSSVAAWDVTVRSSDQTSTIDLNGRLFSYYLALFTGNNGLNLNFPVYPITTDGFRYKIELRGTDPNGFVLYGNQTGFFDSDGTSPLYHDILGADSQLANPQGGVSLARPQFATFFNSIDDTVLPYVNRYKRDGTLEGTSIPLSPIIPTVNNLQFNGTVSGNNSSFGTGGTFNFNSNITGTYELIISRDGSNFDPTNSQNRLLRGIMPTTGQQAINWNGKDNSGNFFPVGSDYKVRVRTYGGEYHFPLLDAENNFTGGPTITMLNAANPIGNTTGFYDDRGYKTIGGSTVGTVGQVLCGINPPNPAFSDPINGFDTASNNRKFGQSGNAGNAGSSCNGSFGDTKGLDLWTYYPGTTQPTPFNIINAINAKLLLVKRITRINNQDITDIVDGRSDVATTAANYIPEPYATEDNDAKWPAGYLRGVINAGAVKPGDELEYTIYFLSKGPNDATNVKFCDLVPSSATFISTAFNSNAPTDGGLSAADRGIALAVSSSNPTVYLSNVEDGDRGRFYPANQSVPSSCGTNNNGAVVVNITRTPDLPNLIKDVYGFVRFRAKVK
ncbi:DUF11 domain-containing protein [Nostoc sp. 2RC]|uniref:DUF11 domain-containing protein n=1 Tax=Nostoc sp. 2RC TaxID=2485484 RepID=UPI001624D1F6|nr:DUF11 domain-containing protein [Nostoc sp. 2RC]MBC1240790.1 DUF11 domain-containing protein [Nostoc sp. 2RC]